MAAAQIDVETRDGETGVDLHVLPRAGDWQACRDHPTPHELVSKREGLPRGQEHDRHAAAQHDSRDSVGAHFAANRDGDLLRFRAHGVPRARHHAQ